MRFRCGLALLLLGLSTGPAFSQILVYGFTSSSAAPTSSASNLTGGSVSTGGGVTTTSNTSPVSSGYAGASGGYFISDNGWTGAAPGTNYFQFTITPSSGYSVSIASISFGYRESGASTGPTNFYIRSSVDSYGSNLGTGTLTNSDNSWHSSGNTSVTLTFTSATTVRLYANSASSGTPTLRFDDISVNGSVSAIPEPSTYAIWFGVAALGVAVAKRRKSFAQV